MQPKLLTASIMAAGLTLGATAQAADVRINGFMSVVGGTTLSEGTARSHLTGAESKSTFTADSVTLGVYDDDISFKPDTNYGIQISSNLGSGLSVTGQITGNGGEDFEANVAWAYISYDLSDTWTLQAGRQRLPLFYYSDFLDVAYAYHWLRTPQQTAGALIDTFEGVKFSYANTTDNWDWNFSAFGGAGDEDIGQGFTGKMEDMMGLVGKVGNDWLQLRASYATMDLEIGDGAFSTNGVVQGTDDNPAEYSFFGLASHMTFDNVFVVAEYTFAEVDEPFGADFGASGFTEDTGWYISSGIRLGSVTPHITYGNRVSDLTQIFGTTTLFETEVSYWTLGARWDFHPSAAAKLEYTSQSDDSDDFAKNTAGPLGAGYGDTYEVDVISIGIDVIF